MAVGRLSLPREEDRHLTGVWARHIRAQRAEVSLFDLSHGVIQRMRPVVGPRNLAAIFAPTRPAFAGEGGDFEVDPLSQAMKQGLERRETPGTEHGEQGHFVSLRTELLRHLQTRPRPRSNNRRESTDLVAEPRAL